ncbi:MAG: NACHT domain-containing protein, partial [Planctomycetales bacterium]|nr:NACHT domain-containing protein [Planctomycetales bacterium]
MDADRSPPTAPVTLDLDDGLTVAIAVRLDSLPVAIAHVLHRLHQETAPAHQSLLTVTVANSATVPRDLTIAVHLPGFSDLERQTVTLPPGQTQTCTFFPRFDDEKLAALTQLHPAAIHVVITAHGVSHTTHLSVDLLAVNAAPMAAKDSATGVVLDLTPYLGAFVTAEDPSLADFIHAAATYLPAGQGFDGYVSPMPGVTNDATPQVEAFFRALAACNIVYDHAPLAFNPAEATLKVQRLQFPAQVLDSGLANCLEGAALFAALLERHKIETAIVLVPRHALVGWKARPDSAWSYLDTTQLERDFAHVCADAAGQVEVAQQAAALTGNQAWFRLWPLADLRARHIYPPRVTEHATLLRALDRHADIVQRRQELLYLNALLHRCRLWRDRYVTLSGVEHQTPRPTNSIADEIDEWDALFSGPAFRRHQAEGTPVDIDDIAQVIRQHTRADNARAARLVLLGEPGAGKTTTLLRLVLEHALAARLDPAAPLPILAELESYRDHEDARAFIDGQLGLLQGRLHHILANKRAVLFLDALNQLPQDDRIGRVRRIDRFLRDHRSVPAVVTCRALDYEDEYAAILDLERLYVKPLPVERQRELIHRYLDRN